MKEIILLDESEAAALLGVQTKTMSSWRNRGTGPVFRKIGRLCKYLRSDLEDYLERQKRQSTSENPDNHAQNRKKMRVRKMA